MTTRQISETIDNIYAFEVSESMVSVVTDRFLSQIEEWRNRPLAEIYPIVLIDAIYFFTGKMALYGNWLFTLCSVLMRIAGREY